MPKVINKLSELVSNQIAAGEVVQRPSSVVKELMENAIDAGSESVSVSVVNGGKDEIQVYDEGSGIHYDDAVIAFERHATSKICQTDDLYSLRTFGFRGEALASIASVAEVEMHTCQENEELGTIVIVRGGELVSYERGVSRKGTQFVVRNLFYNVPARRRSLDNKSLNGELESVKMEFKKIALCYPRLSFLLLSNRKEVYNLPVTNLRRRVADIMGQRTASALLEVYTETDIVEVKGYIGKPENAKKRSEQFMFVNNRYFRHPALQKAVLRAYENLLPTGMEMQPQYFLYLTVPPDKIDVNIHPSKIEVHFDEENDIIQILLTAIKGSLGKSGIVPMIDFSPSSRIEMTPVVDSDDVEVDMSSFEHQTYEFNPFNEDFSFSKALGNEAADEEAPEVSSYYASTPSASFSYQEEVPSRGLSSPVEINSSSSEEEPQFVEIESETLFGGIEDVDAILKDVFPFGENYLVALLSSRMLFINVRRAMSRILFDRYSSQITTKKLPSQKLLFQVDVSFSRPDREIIDASISDLENMGFELCESAVDGALTVVAVPIDFNSDNVNGFFESFLDCLKIY
ncbi:MAG: DNA mismatch repair endonuclease MutL [Rikenellaceae bacterium]